MSFLRFATRTTAVPFLNHAAPRIQHQLLQRARFSSPAGLSRDVIQSRVFNVLKEFEKVDSNKVSKNELPTHKSLH